MLDLDLVLAGIAWLDLEDMKVTGLAGQVHHLYPFDDANLKVHYLINGKGPQEIQDAPLDLIKPWWPLDLFANRHHSSWLGHHGSDAHLLCCP